MMYSVQEAPQYIQTCRISHSQLYTMATGSVVLRGEMFLVHLNLKNARFFSLVCLNFLSDHQMHWSVHLPCELRTEPHVQIDISTSDDLELVTVRNDPDLGVVVVYTISRCC